MDRAFVAQSAEGLSVYRPGAEHPARAYQTTRNTVTAWWDASQLYGYDDELPPAREARPGRPGQVLLMLPLGRDGAGDKLGYLPRFEASDPINPEWSGQEATAFPDNWSIGMSFYHNVFAREHNQFVDAFRKRAAATPDADCGLRDPVRPEQVIRYRTSAPTNSSKWRGW